MDVSCPQCETVYEVEELNAYSAAISLQCSQCSFVFRLPAPGHSIQENQRRWMIRSHQSGDILYFNTFDMLHRWIMEGKVGGDDTISRTGERWTALKSIGEFAPIFQTVESIAKIADTRPGLPAGAAALLPKPLSKPLPKPSSDPRQRGLSQEVLTQVIPGMQSEPPRSHTLPFGAIAASRNPDTAQLRRPISIDTPTQPSRPVPQRAPSHSAQLRAAPRDVIPDFPQLPPARPEETWSFGDSMSALDQGEHANREPTKTWGFYDTNAATRRSHKRRTIIVGFVVVMILGGSAAAYFAQDSLQVWWNSAFASRSVIKLGDSQAVVNAEITPEKDEVATEPSLPSVAENLMFTTSSQQIHLAVVSARDRQKQHHQEVQAQAVRAVKKPKTDEGSDEKPSSSNDLGGVLAKAKSALERGNATYARQLYHQAVRLDPQSAEAIAGLGWSLLSLGNADSARAQFRRAKYRDPDFEGSYIGLGRAERELGNNEEALRAYEDYLKRFPDGPQVTIARYQSQELKRQLGE